MRPVLAEQQTQRVAQVGSGWPKVLWEKACKWRRVNFIGSYVKMLSVEPKTKCCIRAVREGRLPNCAQAVTRGSSVWFFSLILWKATWCGDTAGRVVWQEGFRERCCSLFSFISTGVSLGERKPLIQLSQDSVGMREVNIPTVGLLSENCFLASPFGSWKCKVLKGARALTNAGSECSGVRGCNEKDGELSWLCCSCKWTRFALQGAQLHTCRDLLEILKNSVSQLLVPLLLTLTYRVMLSCISVPCCAALGTFGGTPPGLESKHKMGNRGIETMQENKKTIMVSCLVMKWIIPPWLVGGQWIAQWEERGLESVLWTSFPHL